MHRAGHDRGRSLKAGGVLAYRVPLRDGLVEQVAQAAGHAMASDIAAITSGAQAAAAPARPPAAASAASVPSFASHAPGAISAAAAARRTFSLRPGCTRLSAGTAAAHRRVGALTPAPRCVVPCAGER